MKFLEDKPIWLQIEAEVRRKILTREWPEGAKIPSAREMAADLAVNPATVMRAYDALHQASLVESRRGIGSFVSEGAHPRVLAEERRIFYAVELPAFRQRMKMLGVRYEDEQ